MKEMVFSFNDDLFATIKNIVSKKGIDLDKYVIKAKKTRTSRVV
jgi:hypothetical protein